MSDNRQCPHCNCTLDPWIGPPESGWGMILVCNNDDCTWYRNSNKDIQEQGGKDMLGYKYAEDPANNYEAMNLVCWVPTAHRCEVEE